MRLWSMAFSLLLVLAAAPVWAQPPHKPIEWRLLRPGVSFARIETTRYVQLGEPYIGAVRLNPEQVRFQIYHFRDLPAGRPLNVEGWQEQTGALAVFNPGQYDEEGTHLGLLICDGINIGTGILSIWKGIFVAEPRHPTLPKAVLIDLAYTPFDPGTSLYTQAVQSFMLLDRQGRKRVRESDWVANRTVLATDRAGRIIVLCTEGGYTLWDLASWLAESELEIVQAMSMDGGYKAEMAVRFGDFQYVTYGQWETTDFGNLSLPGFKATLPAVVGVFPR